MHKGCIFCKRTHMTSEINDTAFVFNVEELQSIHIQKIPLELVRLQEKAGF